MKLKPRVYVWISLAAITASLGLFQNCSSGGSLNIGSKSNGLLSANTHAPTATELVGIWNSACQVDTGAYFKMSLTFSDTGQVDIVVSNYSDTSCTTQTFIDTYTGLFTLNASSVANAGQVQYTLSLASRAPTTAPVAAGFNASSMCGQMGWMSGISKNIAPGTPCLLFGTNVTTVLGINGNDLYLGNDANSALDPSRHLTR